MQDIYRQCHYWENAHLNIPASQGNKQGDWIMHHQIWFLDLQRIFKIS